MQPASPKPDSQAETAIEAERAALAAALPPFEQYTRLFYDDGLGRDGCINGPTCQSTTRSFREIASRARKVGTRFMPCTLSEFLVIPQELTRQGLYAVATFDLDAHADFDAVMEAARTLTKKRGRVNREIARAKANGYYAKAFALRDHVEDVVAIHDLKPVRDSRPMEGDLYRRRPDELAKQTLSDEGPCCPQHYHEHWGIFRKRPGHRQNGVEVGEELVAYIGLARRGACAWYNAIMGHGDHLKYGIMYLLHYALVARFMNERPEGLRYLAYYTFVRRPGDVAAHWKYLALFKPFYFHYVDDRAVSLPAKPPMPGLAEGLLALKQTMALEWPDALAQARSLDIPTAWLGILHRAWVVETTRAPSLVRNILRAGPDPPLELLRPLASGVFPLAALGEIRRAAVILHGRGRGLDTLLPIHDAGIANVAVFHDDEAEREALRATYPANWSYEAVAAGGFSFPDTAAAANLLVMETPSTLDANAALPVSFHGHLLVAANAKLFAALDANARSEPAVLADKFGALVGAKLRGRGVFFRHGHPDEQFWL